MPGSITRPVTSTFSIASQVPEEVWRALELCPVNSNVILPILKKSLQREQKGLSPPEDQSWISCSSYNPNPTIEFVLSVTSNDIDRYPIFITTTRAYDDLTEDFLHPYMAALARALKEVVPKNRVYSVFAPEPVTIVFCRIWTELTGIRPYKEPYYHAKITYCNKRSVYRSQTLRDYHTHNYELRPALPEDHLAVAELCKGFSIEGEPFVLDDQGAHDEASVLIQNNQVWVYSVQLNNSSETEIASICAFTRNSDNVATISKVYTNPQWRRQGCAERLVRCVCKQLLKTKEKVALYVAHSNPAAAKVYHRVGFLGLQVGGEPVEGVDSWMEIGFDRSQVSLGYW